MNKQHVQKAQICKALGHPIRFCIVEGLLGGERNVAEITGCLGIAQPTVSQHLNILKTAGVVEGVRDGNQIRYAVVHNGVKAIIEAMK